MNNNVTSEGGESKERVIPIRRENGGPNVTSNGNSNMTSNGVSISSNVTPKRPAGLIAPKVNGFSPVQQANAMGLRQNGASKPTTPVEVRNGKSSDQNGATKQSVVRKLSPLSPKHIVVPPGSGEKPAITPKPEHLKSPPMSPSPPASPSSPPTPVRSSQPSPTGASTTTTSCSEPAKKAPVETPSQVEEDIKSPSKEVNPSPPLATIVPQTLNNNITTNNNNQKEVESPSLASPRSLDSSYEDNEEDYPEEFYEQYQHQPTGGLRERELLCPIMEEDNESTASGSTCNLATPRDNNTVIGDYNMHHSISKSVQIWIFLSNDD